MVRLAWIEVLVFGLLGFITGIAQAQWRNFDGEGGGKFTIEDTDIGKVDGPGNWVLFGVGQDLTIHEKKDGTGNLTLKGFGKIKIVQKKDGDGKLIIEEDNGAVSIKEVNGNGNVYLRNKELNRIDKKDGRGAVYWKHRPPIIGEKNGPGIVDEEGK